MPCEPRFSCLLILCFIAGCSNGDNTNNDSGPDADMDARADGDLDAGGDGDLDARADGDLDAGGDGDIGADGDVDGDSADPDAPPLCGRWRMDPETPILSSGEVSSLIDYVAASDPHVIVVDGRLHMYYTCAGCLVDCDAEDEVRTRICLATSDDGILFERYEGNPVLEVGPPGSWDSFGIETAFVMEHEASSEVWMYYNGADTDDGDTWLAGDAETMGSIGLATSPDGFLFERVREDPVLRPSEGEGLCRCGSWDSWVVEGPWVMQLQGRYWMWFGAAGSMGDGEPMVDGIGLAYSDDGIYWPRREPEPVLSGDSGAWDEYHLIDPSIIETDGMLWAWYHGGDFAAHDWYGNFRIGVASSHNGVDWDRSHENPVLDHGGAGTWTAHGVMAPSLVEFRGERLMYFHGLDDYPGFTVWAIGRALLVE